MTTILYMFWDGFTESTPVTISIGKMILTNQVQATITPTGQVIGKLTPTNQVQGRIT